MSDDQQKTRETLLDELESIKYLLEESDLNLSLNRTAVTADENTTNNIIASRETTLKRLEDAPAVKKIAEKNSPPPNTSLAPGVLPGQQSLFELCPEPSAADSGNSATTGKNPFLTDKTKARGESRKTEPNDSASSDKNRLLSKEEILQQIDAIVASYLPRLEAELREKLKSRLLPRR